MANTKSVLGTLRHKISRLRPRHFHCYCVGAAKTGTTSIANSFQKNYRVAHEPETEQTNRLIIHYLENKITKKSLIQELKKRDRRLNLEMESAHPLGYVAGDLAEIFPKALFIITIREPLSWLKSRLNYHHKRHPPAWEEYRDYFWIQKNTEYAPEEQILKEYNLCSLDTYLQQYADHYRRVLAEVPEDRRMIIKTSDINQSLPLIAEFLGQSSINLEPKHSNREENKIQPLEAIDAQFVQEKIDFHCHDLITRFF